jgi:aminopeptidase C
MDIDDKLLNSFMKDFHKNSSYTPLQRSVTANGVFGTLSNIYASATNTTVFSH